MIEGNGGKSSMWTTIRDLITTCGADPILLGLRLWFYSCCSNLMK